MPLLNRRRLIAGAGFAGAATSLAGFGRFAVAQAKARIVIVGGGMAGATVAVRLKSAMPTLDLVVVEPSKRFTTCMLSNLFYAGFRTLESLTHDYDGLTRAGIKVVHDTAAVVDVSKKSVTLKTGGSLSYDRLVLAPGIDLEHESIEDYSEAASGVMPHAYKPGLQPRLLKRQIEDMPDGGTVVISAPKMPYRCPPAPYERACMIAFYLRREKPRSKVIVLDAKREIPKGALFEDAFANHYKDIVELRKSTDIDDFTVTRVDPVNKEVITRNGFRIKASVANIIPAQKAGRIAVDAGLTEGNWVPVDPSTFKARKASDVYVIGDAANVDPMPKSAFAANAEAKLVAATLAAELGGKPKYPPRLRNTCWSALACSDVVKIAQAYRIEGDKVVEANRFLSAVGETPLVRAKNAREYFDWYDAISAEAFPRA